MKESRDTIRALQWSDNALRLLDQRRLPAQETYLTLTDVRGVAEAIRVMAVRGAPAIGLCAAYGIVLAARARYAHAPLTWKQDIENDFTLLSAARPTAVNLFWALARMRKCMVGIDCEPEQVLLAEAKRIHQEDVAANHRIGTLGAALLKRPCAVLTHCNAGSLATGGFGTALGVIRSAYEAGTIERVYVNETRPWLQGARLSAWELLKERIPVTLIADAAAAALFRQGTVEWVIVGADRIAANGDVANKIGTYGAALAARHHGVKFMVAAPSSSVDLSLTCGEHIPIEIRSADEVLCLAGQRLAAAGANAWNPAFDVTPAALIDVIVTERGVVHAPTEAKMAAMMASEAV
jgi:S-methyl-5-thioribose-1-phosphate isomerase